MKNKHPAVSIILPYYNAASTLHRAIDSILNQTFTNFELLLINNNSSDRGLLIAQEYAQQDQRVILLNETKQGVVFTANLGIQKSQGEYISRMDADDWAHPTKLAQQVEFLNLNPNIGILATQVNYMNENLDNADQGFSHFVNWSNQQCQINEIFNNRFVEFPVVNPTLMIRKEVFDRVGDYREGDYPEDYEWFLRAISEHKIAKLSVPLLDWYDSDTRLTRVDQRYATDAFFMIKTEYIAKYIIENHKLLPNIWIWGAGKLGYRRSQWLLQYGIEVAGYIDIKKGKAVEGYPCVHFESISLENQSFIISYISNRGRRDEVRAFLNDLGYTEGVNYLIAG